MCEDFAQNLATKELAVEARQRNAPHFLFHHGIVHEKQHDCLKILGFHGGDYEECCLLGYESPACTSQETHYFSATEPNQLMPCKI
jgi:hypothetical protein